MPMDIPETRLPEQVQPAVATLVEHPPTPAGTPAGTPSAEEAQAIMTPSTFPKVVDLLEERLLVFKNLIKNLIRYFELLADCHSANSETYSRTLHLFTPEALTLKKNEQTVFGPNSELEHLVEKLKEYSSNERNENNQMIQTLHSQVITVLQHFMTEIKRMSKEIRSDSASSLDKEFTKEKSYLDSILNQFMKGLEERKQVINILQKHHAKPTQTGEAQVLETLPPSSGPNIQDPWLLSIQLQSRKKEQNDLLQRHLITARRRQDEFFAFENNVIITIKKAIGDYFSVLNMAHNGLAKRRDEVLDIVGALDSEKEKKAFMDQYPGRLLPMTPITTEAFAGIPQLTDPLLNVVYEAPLLLKKTGIIPKGWKQDVFMLTGTGYLHGFPEHARTKSQDDMKKVEPEISICLSDYILQPHPMIGREMDEIELQEAGRTSGLFSKAPVTHIFKATSQETATTWWNMIAPFTRLAMQIQTPTMAAVQGKEE